MDFASGIHLNKTLGYVADDSISGRYAGSEAGANVTRNHVLTAPNSPTGSAYSWWIPETLTAVSFLGWSAQTAGSWDVYNLVGSLAIQLSSTSASVTVAVVLDGDTANPVLTNTYSLSGAASSVWVLPLLASLSGLTAGSHTIQVYMSVTGVNGAYLLGSQQVTFASIQRIF
jgi:hypothetical protein